MSKAATQLDDRDAAILERVQAATIARPVTIRDVQLWLINRGFKRPSERVIKKTVERLRNALHPIGSSRGLRDKDGNLTVPPGYFYCRTDEDKRLAMAEYKKQVMTELRTMRAFSRSVTETARLQSLGEQLALIDI